MCHFYICLNLYPSHGNVNILKTWVEYLSLSWTGLLKISTLWWGDKRIAKAMKAGGHEDVVLEEEDGEYERGHIFLSFHY